MSQFTALVEEQIEYYKARASQYDEWFERRGRYYYSDEHTAQWNAEADQVRARLASVQKGGDMIEFAPGTGIWTEELVKYADSVTAVDASAEMLTINQNKLQSDKITYIQANIFEYEPTQQYDFVFFGFWLSHVPPENFEPFFDLVTRCLKPGGQFFFVDSLYHPESVANNHQLRGPDAKAVSRKLNDGRQFDIVKIFYVAEELEARLRELGWDATITGTDRFFLHGWGSRR